MLFSFPLPKLSYRLRHLVTSMPSSFFTTFFEEISIQVSIEVASVALVACSNREARVGFIDPAA